MVFEKKIRISFITNEYLGLAPRKIAEKLNIKNIKASNTWINIFKKNYGIKNKSICGEEHLVDKNKLMNTYEEFLKTAENTKMKTSFM